MRSATLDALASQLTPANGQIALDGVTLDAPGLIWLADLFGQDRFDLSNATCTPHEDRIELTGQTPVFGQPAPVAITIFESVASGTTARAFEIVFRTTAPLADFSLNALTTASVATGSPPAPAPGLADAVRLAGATATASTFDFAPDEPAPRAWQAALIDSTPFTTARPGLSLHASGLSIAPEIAAALPTLPGGIGTALPGWLSQGANSAHAVIQITPRGERRITLTYPLTAQSAAFTPPFAGELTLDMEAVGLSMSLDGDGQSPIGLSLAGSLVQSGQDARASAVLTISTGGLRIEGVFSPGADVGWLAGLALGETLGKAVTDMLPDLVLTRFSAGIMKDAWTTSVALGSASAWKLVPGVLEIEPRIVVFGASEHAPDVDIGGLWILGGDGGPEFDVHVDVQTGAVFIAMLPGQSLDLGSLGEHLGLPELRDAITVLDLELTGSVRSNAFDLVVACSSTLQMDAFGHKFALTDLDLLGSRDETGQYSWTIEGVFSLGGAAAAVTVVAGESYEFKVALDTLAVGDILDTALQGLDLPRGLQDFSLHDIVVDFRPDVAFSLTAGASSPVSLIDGLDLTLTGFHAVRASTGVTGDLTLELDLGDAEHPVRLLLSSAYDNGEWTFAGAVMDRVPLGALVQRLAAAAGLPFPLPTAGLEVTVPVCRVHLGAMDHVALECDVFDGDRRYGDLKFAAWRGPVTEARPPAPWTCVLAFDVELDVGLHDLPVVGPRLPDYSVQTLSVMIASADTPSGPPADIGLPLPSGPVTKGAEFALKVADGGEGQVLRARTREDGTAPTLPAGAGTATGPAPTDAPAAPAPITTGPVVWKAVDKAYGPVSVDRIGLRLHDGRLALLFDARLSLGPVAVGLDGLGFSSSLDHLSLEGELSGLSIDYASGPISLGGGLERTADGYAGQLHLATGSFSFVLLGEYIREPEGLFAFGMTQAPPLGGPPAFFVEGVAIGAGWNSQLNLPKVPADVAGFSLVEAAMGSGGSPISPSSDLTDALAVLGRDTSAASGEGWLAGGVKFTSFKLIESFALLTVQFGVSNRISVLGLSRATLPPQSDDSPVALIEVGLIAEFDADQGALKIDGALTPRSYVLSRDAVLTGGFGFYAWFKDGPGVSAGDFVYTMGGYHPRFKAPAHYPQPPRLSLNWQVSGDMSVKGSSYFALTPHAMMAGISMEALWSSGDLSAWFDAAADFLIYWKPFHYVAEIDTSIGVSYRLNLLFTTVHITVHVGVSLRVEGPPFGGSAHIDLDVVSFTVSFGDDSDDHDFLAWDAFRTDFLPAGDKVCTVQAVQGLLHDRSPIALTGEPRWILSPDAARLVITLSAPAKTLDVGKSPAPKASWSTNLGIAPMGVSTGAFQSDLTVKVMHKPMTRAGQPEAPWAEYPVDHGAITRAAPHAVWGEAQDVRPGDPNAPILVPDALYGMNISSWNPVPDHTAEVSLSALRYTDAHDSLPLAWTASWPSLPEGDGPHDGPELVVTSNPGGEERWAGGTIPLSGRNDVVISGLAALNLADPAFAADPSAAVVLDAWPLIRKLGQL